MVQWLKLDVSTTRDLSLIPGQGAEIPHITWLRQKNKKTKITVPTVSNIKVRYNGKPLIENDVSYIQKKQEEFSIFSF